ncbi:MAG TPA: Clp protease N-terminal domain-containing protein [Gemmataceae bacterium]|nr:Clp protease N-terminal domain-containing protein [Gemmataceae bacterium]
MYERFTDRARKVLQLANQEANRLNHEYVGTEHILLGLVKEGVGVAAVVLKNHGLDLHKTRLEVEVIAQPGPDHVTPGKLLQTRPAKRAVVYSIDEARNLNHNYIGTEHLLLGLLREQEGVAAQLLMNLGLKLDDVREAVLRLLGAPCDAGSTRTQAAVHPARRLGRWVRRHELDLIFVGGVLAPLLGAAFTALVQALPNPGVGGLIAGVVYVCVVFAACLLAKDIRPTRMVNRKDQEPPR